VRAEDEVGLEPCLHLDFSIAIPSCNVNYKHLAARTGSSPGILPPAEIRVHLRDLGEPLVEAWRRAFAGVDGVTVSRGDIFSTRPGPIAPDAPLDVKADAIVSPANSFGFMNGGIDLVYTYQLGQIVEDRRTRGDRSRSRRRAARRLGADRSHRAPRHPVLRERADDAHPA
jgi:hypothetical protein